VSAISVREHVRPPRQSKERGRTRGVVREQVGFKADPETVEYIDREASIENWTRSTVVHDMVTTQIDLEKELGSHWWEIEAEAVRRRTTKGKVLAALVEAALKAKK
jgi:hypothetical protein